LPLPSASSSWVKEAQNKQKMVTQKMNLQKKKTTKKRDF
jgi:hypothetical protein